MNQSKAFSIAHRLLSHNLVCKLYRDTDGVWHVQCVDSVKYNELFGDMK